MKTISTRILGMVAMGYHTTCGLLLVTLGSIFLYTMDDLNLGSSCHDTLHWNETDEGLMSEDTFCAKLRDCEISAIFAIIGGSMYVFITIIFLGFCVYAVRRGKAGLGPSDRSIQIFSLSIVTLWVMTELVIGNILGFFVDIEWNMRINRLDIPARAIAAIFWWHSFLMLCKALKEMYFACKKRRTECQHCCGCWSDRMGMLDLESSDTTSKSSDSDSISGPDGTADWFVFYFHVSFWHLFKEKLGVEAAK